jgi:hypothetical protein
MGLQTSYGKGPLPLLWAGSRAARAKITSGRPIPNRLNYCVICIVSAHFTNVAAGRKIQPDGPRVGNPCSKLNKTLKNHGNKNLLFPYHYEEDV